MNFDFLVQQIESTHIILNRAAVKAVNIHLTLRNWLIGFYIVEFEQKGENRAEYGSRLISTLSASLRKNGLSNINERELRRYRLFYKTYSVLGNVFSQTQIRGSLPPELAESVKRGAVTPESNSGNLNIVPEKLVNSLSFTHIAELIEIEDPIKRSFYELECIKGQWSVRELQRQINTLYFERSGLSGNPAQMSKIVQAGTQQQNTSDIIKSHFAFEFLGISGKSIIEESDLEQSLLDHFQDFLLEMGRGFCQEIKENFDNPPIGILMVADKNNPLVEYALAGLDNQVFVSQYLLQLPDKKQLQDFITSEIKLL